MAHNVDFICLYPTPTVVHIFCKGSLQSLTTFKKRNKWVAVNLHLMSLEFQTIQKKHHKQICFNDTIIHCWYLTGHMFVSAWIKPGILPFVNVQSRKSWIMGQNCQVYNNKKQGHDYSQWHGIVTKLNLCQNNKTSIPVGVYGRQPLSSKSTHFGGISPATAGVTVFPCLVRSLSWVQPLMRLQKTW